MEILFQGKTHADSKKHLIDALNNLASILEEYTRPDSKKSKSLLPESESQERLIHKEKTHTVLARLCRQFHLTEFERNILLLCVGCELDERFSSLCSKIHDNIRMGYPTFELALTVFNDAHWSALSPSGPLRKWKLIDLDRGKSLTQLPLFINERILHYLIGVPASDPLLSNISNLPLTTKSLIYSHQKIAEKIEPLWRNQLLDDFPALIQLCGPEIDDKTDIFQYICNQLNRPASVLDCHRLPLNSEKLGDVIREWEREFLLEQRLLFLNCDELDATDPTLSTAVNHFLEDFKGPVFISCQMPLKGVRRQMIRFDIPRPEPDEQLNAWKTSITDLKLQLKDSVQGVPEPHQLTQDLRELTAQFSLSTSMIRQACMAAIGPLQTQTAPSFKQILWESCRVQARPGLDALAERLESKLSWEDLVLPPLQQETLQEIIAHVQQRATVYEKWGFAAKNRRGLGITALFSGPSGTGKTLAAGVLANELALDLYKIELSSVVSKYIGETEKNLQRIFDAAESGGAILLFDEADSIFGKRSEVKDSKDRYANLEVSYLLQRMESYPGLAILTTNLQSNLDSAFLRRLRFVTQFTLPDAAHRAEIWRRMFPATAPTHALNFQRLAQLNAPGGNIRIIALNAAFIAADAGESVQMKHVLKATQSEYEKLGRSLTSVELAGWVSAA